MLKKLQRFFSGKIEINYLYFSILFVVVSIFSLSYMFFLEKPIWGMRLFFLLYAAGQTFLEIWFFVFVAYALKQWTPRWIFLLFISFSFSLLFVHFTDFTLLRLMDSSIAHLFKFLFGRGLEHLVTAIAALNMNYGILSLIGCALVLIPLLGLCVYWATSCVVKFKPLSLSHNQMGCALLITGGFLFLLELFAHPYLDRLLYEQFQKGLPLGTTFLSPIPQRIALPHHLSPPHDEELLRSNLPCLHAIEKPNIYFFVIETLRNDYIDEQTAPHLNAFKQDNIHFASSFANANWTPLSWFAIFHSNFPFHWNTVRDHWNEGSIPLQLLKQMGYALHVYASADLRYFDMDKTLFGQHRKLVDTIVDVSTHNELETCDKDALCITSFAHDLACTHPSEGNAYFFFLDSTHSEYSIPKDFPLKFTPIAKQIDYLTLTQKEIEPVKNRYKNAIVFVDSLLEKCMNVLKQHNLYEKAIVVVTGDHGEEFYEEGALFHGAHLNRYQLEVPIFCKFPKHQPYAQQATHIDLFPSLLHYITGKEEFAPLFDGHSIFSPNRPAYRVAVLQNGPDTPIEFTLAQEDRKLQLRFLPPYQIYTQKELEIISIETPETLLPGDKTELIAQWFPNVFDTLRAKEDLLQKDAQCNAALRQKQEETEKLSLE